MINVTCAIIERGDKILVAQRSPAMDLPLKWEFPGGKMDIGEEAERCVVREISEELSIKIEVFESLTSVIHDYGNKQINLIPFICKYVSGDIILLEHKAVKWLEKSELGHLEWCPADIPILKEYLSKGS